MSNKPSSIEILEAERDILYRICNDILHTEKPTVKIFIDNDYIETIIDLNIMFNRLDNAMLSDRNHIYSKEDFYGEVPKPLY